jgi:RNA polymerase sigma-70 factor (ECF subfamily)
MPSTAQVTDEQLTARAREGDLAAFGALVDRHRAAVVRAALAALGNREDAEDVAQETFVQCHRALHTFRGESSLRTWLLAVAWRRALSRRRSLERWITRREDGWTGEYEDGTRAVREPADPAPTPEREAIGRETRQRVAAVVRALPATLRDPLLLAASGEYSMQEIAALVGAPVGTVKWRVSEARRLLREKLNRLGA